MSTVYPDFIDDAALAALLTGDAPADRGAIGEAIAKSLSKSPLSVEECATLLRADTEDRERVFDAARRLKREVYGNRIVLFAPLYIGNLCINDCRYCAFRRSEAGTVRTTLSAAQVEQQVLALQAAGHKRLILVFGEHPDYSPAFIADTVRRVYAVRKGPGAIRRVNINAAPMETEGYRLVKESGIGTYQIFQETYHHATYAAMHPPSTRKGDYRYRLHGLTRAFEAGCDDVGIGALFGLHDWRFEVLGLVRHAVFLQERFACGPHTISFPRVRPAHGVRLNDRNFVGDEDFRYLVAVLRLCVPYTGLILTAREPPAVRRAVMEFGVSQIDAGTRVELAGYTADGAGNPRREQFQIGDLRSLDEVLYDLLRTGHLPSFCTSCYRSGRTGQHFMEYAVPGFIESFCTPNALLTLAEYIEDYAAPATREAGRALIEAETARIADSRLRETLARQLRAVREEGARDVHH